MLSTTPVTTLKVIGMMTGTMAMISTIKATTIGMIRATIETIIVMATGTTMVVKMMTTSDTEAAAPFGEAPSRDRARSSYGLRGARPELLSQHFSQVYRVASRRGKPGT
jgi:hypothetical protein